jgi:hypothetical protein
MWLSLLVFIIIHIFSTNQVNLHIIMCPLLIYILAHIVDLQPLKFFIWVFYVVSLLPTIADVTYLK